MPQATGRDLHVDAMLTELAINYRPQGMIADQIAPIISVAKETNLYPVFNRGEAFAIEDTMRARGTEAKRVTRSVGSASYAVKNYALAYDLTIEDRANMDAAYQFELEAGATRYLQDKLMLDWDRRVLSQVGTTANVSTGFTVNSAWSGAGDPVAHLWAAQEQMMTQTGLKPNSIVFGWRAWNYFRRNVNVRNLIKGVNNGGGFVSRDNAREILELERLLVAGGFYNLQNEAQTASLSLNPLADSVLLYYAPLSPSRETPSFMYSFRWTAAELGTPMAVIRHAFDTRKRIEGIELQYYQDEKITGSDYGALIRNVSVSTGSGLSA